MENEVQLDHVLFLIVIVLSMGMLFGKTAGRLKLPDVALYLVAGILLGPGLHLVNEPTASFTNQFILTVGSALILFDGGRNIRLSGLRKVWITLTLLSVPGVLITCAAVAVTAYLLLGMPLIYAVLLGAIISSTDPATLIPVFKQVKIRDKVRETVESESAFNDATGSILTFSVLAAITGGQALSLSSGIIEFLQTAVGGIAVGVGIGLLLTFFAGHEKLGFLRGYATIALIVTSLGAYWLGEVLQVSGLMATFTAGLVWGNADLLQLDFDEKRQEMGHFIDNMTVVMRMLIFILLGSQVNFGVIVEYFWPSLGVIAVFMFIARPLTVLASALPDRKARWTWQEIVFMFWVRETGVIPAALAGMVAGLGVKYADIIASVTFLAVLFTILLQASSTAFVARKLGLEEGNDAARTPTDPLQPAGNSA